MTDDAGDTERGDASAAPTVEDTAGIAALLGPGIGERFGRFRVEALLGSGGMGSVYRAYDTLLDREVALKVLHPEHRPAGAAQAEDTSARRRRIIREARAAAGLSHPNTVTIYEVGDVDGVPFIAMELLRGKSLRTLMRDGGAIAFSKKLEWLLCAARALDAAHGRGLVHRDVKPDNMFVCEDGTLKLLDFGIAKTGDDESIDGASGGPSSLRTELGRRVGTPRYMAPEQRDGSGTDARTDQYAWGLVAFELLTGSDPREAETSDAPGADPASRVDAGYEAVLRKRAPELAAPVARGIARALSVGRDGRFASMSPLVSLLEEREARPLAPAAAVSSPPAGSPATRTRRPRLLLALAAPAALAVAVATVAGVARFAGKGSSVTPSASSPAAAAPACRVESTRTVTGETPDLLTLLRGDAPTVVGWYKPDRALKLETGFMREGDAGALEPFSAYPGSSRDRSVVFQGTSFRAKPAFVSYQSTIAFGVYTAWSAIPNVLRLERFDLIGTGIAAAERPDGLMTVVTGFKAAKPHPSVVWTQTWLHENAKSDRQLVYDGESANIAEPAVAVDGGRTAVTFTEADHIMVLFVDGGGVRTGDAIKVVSGGASAPAIAFAGGKLLIVWRDATGANARLRAMTLDPSNRAPEPSVAITDDALAPVRPILVARPGGDPLLVWGAHVFGEAVLRVAPVGGDLRVRAPLDVARGSTLRSADAAPVAGGVSVAWLDDGAARVARVACGAPR